MIQRKHPAMVPKVRNAKTEKEESRQSRRDAPGDRNYSSYLVAGGRTRSSFLFLETGPLHEESKSETDSATRDWVLAELQGDRVSR